MRFTCCRCKNKTKQDGAWCRGWAIIENRGYVCPVCYGLLQEVRGRIHAYEAKAFAKFFKAVKP